MQLAEPIIARITKVSKHPKADRLKVCQVDTNDSGGTLQVWTGLPAATACCVHVQCLLHAPRSIAF